MKFAPPGFFSDAVRLILLVLGLGCAAIAALLWPMPFGIFAAIVAAFTVAAAIKGD